MSYPEYCLNPARSSQSSFVFITSSYADPCVLVSIMAPKKSGNRNTSRTKAGIVKFKSFIFYEAQLHIAEPLEPMSESESQKNISVAYTVKKQHILW